MYLNLSTCSLSLLVTFFVLRPVYLLTGTFVSPSVYFFSMIFSVEMTSAENANSCLISPFQYYDLKLLCKPRECPAAWATEKVIYCHRCMHNTQYG